MNGKCRDLRMRFGFMRRLRAGLTGAATRRPTSDQGRPGRRRACGPAGDSRQPCTCAASSACASSWMSSSPANRSVSAPDSGSDGAARRAWARPERRHRTSSCFGLQLGARDLNSICASGTGELSAARSRYTGVICLPLSTPTSSKVWRRRQSAAGPGPLGAPHRRGRGRRRRGRRAKAAANDGQQPGDEGGGSHGDGKRRGGDGRRSLRQQSPAPAPGGDGSGQLDADCRRTGVRPR